MADFKLIRDADHVTPDGISHPGEFIAVQRQSDFAGIPFSGDNRDCRIFLWLWMAGVPVVRPNNTPFAFTIARRTQLHLDMVQPQNPDEP